MRGFLRDVDQYWFGYGSPVALGVARILLGALIFFNLLMLVPHFGDWFTEQGFVPQEVARSYFPPVHELRWGDRLYQLPFGIPRINLLGGIGSPVLAAALLAITTLAALFTAIGLWTRAASVAMALGLVTLHHRNGMILHGGDTVIRVFALYLALSPCGKACSLDRIIALWKGRAAPEVPAVSLWPQRLMTYNVALIYFTTVWLKWTGNVWREGLGTWYPARLNEFKRFPVPDFLNDLPFVYFSSYATLLIELSLATLVFYRPLRKWVLLSGLLLHGYIEYAMNIPLFSFTMCSLYVLFYEGQEITLWAARLGDRWRRLRLRVALPAGLALRPGPAAALDALDPFDLVRYESGGADHWSAFDEKGRPRHTFRSSAARSVGAWVFAWVPGLWRRLLRSAAAPESRGEGADRVSPGALQVVR